MPAPAHPLPLATAPVRERPRPQPVVPAVHQRPDDSTTVEAVRAKPARTLQITPELIEFYKNRAHDLRAEAIRNAKSTVWTFLTGIVRPR